ncbi:putative acyl-protein thioesterase 1,2 [Tricharina praecox]|uniref:putative acyl-protein thioesterase 1,2 n=1 Tax=Tricharina praecox TaxID=43433 RepID=UPI0022203540|nr:putative acyl-protein thioesterase 1,2 [Tricharina praecox]KAI5847590.1 putative acyl-protein thioesterase 1,2 [Tricharina praecox]
MAEPHIFPTPFVVSPIGEHTHTLILLHGRGDSGPSFGSGLYIATPSSGFSLPSLYPGLKFMFPTTAVRYSTTFREDMNEWFDTASLTFPEEQGHLQREGLREAVIHLSALIEAEVRNGIPHDHIIVGGISQGCATALHVLLALGHQLGGFVGMSGWLPFASNIREICGLGSGAGLRASAARPNDTDDDSESEEEYEEEEEEEDEKAGGAEADHIDAVEALAFVRENLSMPPPPSGVSPLNALKTPCFLAHGDEDETVDYKLGRNIYSALRHGLGMDVTWKRYKEFGHWYKEPDEIDDIVEFLGEKCGLIPQ